VPNAARRYISVTFSGYSVFAEKIGFMNQDEYIDFQHITSDFPFLLIPDAVYEFAVAVSFGLITLTCNGVEVFRVFSGEALNGRVGLRPWRSTLICERFAVHATDTENAA
jgi:hypothetical protein